MTPSADLSGDVTIGVASPADLAGVITAGVAPSADLAGDSTVGVASPAVAEVASSADLAGVVSTSNFAVVASSAVAEVASSAFAEVASSADLAEVASSADLASFDTSFETFRMNVGTVFWSRVTVIMFLMILLRWCPWPHMLEGSRLAWCLRPIQIVLLLLVCHMWNSVRTVVCHRRVSDCYRLIRTFCLISRRLLWWVLLARELPGS